MSLCLPRDLKIVVLKSVLLCTELWTRPSTYTSVLQSIVANYYTQLVTVRSLYVRHDDCINQTLIYRLSVSLALVVMLFRHRFRRLSCCRRPGVGPNIMPVSREVWHDSWSTFLSCKNYSVRCCNTASLVTCCAVVLYMLLRFQFRMQMLWRLPTLAWPSCWMPSKMCSKLLEERCALII